MPKKTNLLGKENLAERLKIAKQELVNTLEESISPPHQKKEEVKNDKENHISDNNKHKEILSSTKPKLYVAGRFNRKKHNYKSKAFYIHEGLDAEIKKYCRGTDITVYNYLISLGLDAVKQRSGMKTADAVEVEEKYSE